MRCRNCGWENNLGALKCEKCNAPLNGSMLDNVGQYHRRENPDNNESDSFLQKTVSDSSFFKSMNGSLRKCPNCGYPYGSDLAECPNCGKSMQSEDKKSDNRMKQPSSDSFAGTVNPWAKPQGSRMCTLTPVAWEDETEVPAPNKYSGNRVVLNRDNTDPQNKTITSKEQALLTFEDGVWYIEDRSQQQTTYIHVSRKMKLSDGDVVILGNRRFIFNK